VDHADLLAGLDEGQRRAVTTKASPLCVLAGAGSGKTRVLTRRIGRRCLDGDADPRHVLALTFTRKAAAELTTRLGAMELRDLPAAGTFHANAHAQLRHRWAGADRRPPSLLDRKARLLGRIVSGRARSSTGDVATEIEWAKARMVPPEQYAEAATAAHRRPTSAFEQIAGWYRSYEEEKHRKGLIDFDDLLSQCADALEGDRDFAAAQRWRFRHLFVDEFQDVNPLQFRLLTAWLGDRSDLCVVGDPNQAIYQWNGADATFLLSFTELFPGGEVVELTDNYRSTPQVLAVAASVLAGDHGIPRVMQSHRQSGPVPDVVAYASDDDEANGIARAIRDHHGPRTPWSSQAVLVRTNAQMGVIEAALRRAGIPYRERGRSSLTKHPAVRDALSALSRSRRLFTTELADLDIALSERLAAAVTTAALAGDEAGEPVIVDGDDLAFQTLVGLGHEFVGLDPHARADGFPGWLHAAIHRDDDGTSTRAVDVVSFHAAKGLEWPVVHLAGLEDGFAPISHAHTIEALEEERRLVYVAMTRAERVLHCSWAERRRFDTRIARRRRSPYLDSVLNAAAILGEVTSAPVPSTVAASVAASRAVLDGRSAASASNDCVEDRAKQAELLAALRAWRRHRAMAVGVGDQVVLPDRTLDAVARLRPTRPEELLDLPGVGPLKLAEHGDTLLTLVAGHV